MKRPSAPLALLFATAIAACSPVYADGYQDAYAAGLRAQNAGRWEEAAQRFDEAAKLGERYKDRDEARLSYAEAMARLERWDEAEAAYRKVEKESEGRYQGVRAAYAVARLVWDRRGFEEGSAETLRAVRTYPSSGLVRHAVRRLLMQVEETSGAEAALAWLEPLENELHATEAGEAVTYEYGALLARAGQKEQAVKLLLALARAHPYPSGSLTDDAYYVASEILEELGRPKEALSVLQEMLAPAETAYLGNSYRRPRFPQGAYRIAVLYRDPLHDRERAKQAFWSMLDTYFDARQTDDALWQVARMEKEDGRQAEACRALQVLRDKKPDSKFIRCAHHLCPTQAVGERPCSLQVLGSIGLDADAVWAEQPEPEP